MAKEQGRPGAHLAQLLEDTAPWKRTPYEPHIATAFQALVRGDCPGHLQQIAMKWLIEDCCGTYQQPYRPGGPEGERDTTIALGKQWVGQQLAHLINVRTHKKGEQG